MSVKHSPVALGYYTAGFTALTDWVNVYADNGDKPDCQPLVAARHGYFIEDCPGVLLMAEVKVDKDHPGVDYYYERHGEAMFATQSFGGLIPAARVNPEEYVRTMSRSSFERWMAELDAEKTTVKAAGNGR